MILTCHKIVVVGRIAWHMKITETDFDCKRKQIATFVTSIPLLRVYRAKLSIFFSLLIHDTQAQIRCFFFSYIESTQSWLARSIFHLIIFSLSMSSSFMFTLFSTRMNRPFYACLQFEYYQTIHFVGPFWNIQAIEKFCGVIISDWTF